MLLENYEEYARHARWVHLLWFFICCLDKEMNECRLSWNWLDLFVCRLYTGIHAKPKPKFKTGAISESTTALNVGQTNNNETPGAASAIPSSVADINRVTTTTSGQDQQEVANNFLAAAGSASVVTTTQKREAGLAKVQADKKKVDARKKSLRRLWWCMLLLKSHWRLFM